ncbi:LicD family protein [Spirochaeta dissipatitropha]
MGFEKFGGLEKVISPLAENEIPYWIDSGVLLGLVRNNALNAWEKDIDLAVRGSDIEQLKNLVPVYESMGYRVLVNSYRGIIYSIGLKPSEPDELEASLHVYYHEGDYLWSPQTQFYMPPPAPDVYSGKRSWPGKLMAHLIRQKFYRAQTETRSESPLPALEKSTAWYSVSRKIYNALDRGLMAEIWPIREVYVPLTWVVPIDLVFPLTSINIENTEYPVPGKYKDYLSFRYGDWQVPVREWFYWRDDGAVVDQKPLTVRKQLRNNTFKNSSDR